MSQQRSGISYEEFIVAEMRTASDGNERIAEVQSVRIRDQAGARVSFTVTRYTAQNA